MVGSSDASPLHDTEQDASGDEASRGTVHKNYKHLHQVQKARKRKNKEHRKRVEKREEHILRAFKRENAEMEKEIDDLKSKAADQMKKHMMTKLSNLNQIANQEKLVENLLAKPLVQQLVLGADQIEVLLLGNGLKQYSDGIGELKDRVMMLEMQIDVLCRLFLK